MKRFHVLAVQDWGGSHEYWRLCSTHLDESSARQFADDAVRADAPNRDDWWDDHSLEDYETLKAEFAADRWEDLISDNVNPGWNAVWLFECGTWCQSAVLAPFPGLIDSLPDTHWCDSCTGTSKVMMCTGNWKYSAPCPNCNSAAFEAAEIDGDHFIIGPAPGKGEPNPQLRLVGGSE